MTLQRMEHVGIVVGDLAAAIACYVRGPAGIIVELAETIG